MDDSGGMAGKICFFCGQNCAGQPRGKDPKGRYYHTACMEAHRAKSVGGGAPTRPSPTPKPIPAEASYSILGELVGGDGGARPVQQSKQCPGCGAALIPGAVICTSCGYNLNTGGQMQVHVAKAKKVKRGGGGGAIWPTIVGILCIIVAAIDLLVVVGNFIIASNAGQGSYGAGRLVAQSIIPIILAAWLLTGGLGLLKRDAKGALKVKQWAIVKTFLIVVCGSLVIVGIQSDAWEARDMEQLFGTSDKSLAMITMLLNVAWGLPFAAFLLVWMSLNGIKSQVEKW